MEKACHGDYNIVIGKTQNRGRRECHGHALRVTRYVGLGPVHTGTVTTAGTQ